MTPPLDAYDAPPTVIRVGDDVLIRSPHNEACYTMDAVKRLILVLEDVVASTERPPSP